MSETDTKPNVDDPLGPEHRCVDFDDDCKDVPGVAPDGSIRTHLSCWLYDPGCGWCPFLRADGQGALK